MREITPTTRDIQRNYINHRRMADSVGYGYSLDEFDRWISAHDQGIRDAVKPPELTARGHLEAAFEAAYPVPEGRDVPPGVTIIARWVDGEIRVHAMGSTAKNRGTNDYIEVRTLEPLPTLIPDDCMAVWASVAYDETRRLCVRDIRSTGSGNWARGDDMLIGEALIDPKPVPEEES